MSFKKRICVEPGCRTVLAERNSDQRCFFHQSTNFKYDRSRELFAFSKCAGSCFDCKFKITQAQYNGHQATCDHCDGDHESAPFLDEQGDYDLPPYVPLYFVIR